MVGKKAENKELRQSFDRFLRSVKEALTDLSTLEVNSILVHDISADHPPNDQEFLQQICLDLVQWFEKHKTNKNVQEPIGDDGLQQLNALYRSLEESPKEVSKEKLTSTEENALKALRLKASRCLEHKIIQLRPEQANERSEYRRHLRYLAKYVVLHESPNWNWSEKMLEGRDRDQLRKLWELVATEFVYAQTVLGLDGDVISRVNQKLFDITQQIDAGNAKELIGFHRRNVEAGSNYRNHLIDTFFNIIKQVLGR